MSLAMYAYSWFVSGTSPQHCSVPASLGCHGAFGSVWSHRVVLRNFEDRGLFSQSDYSRQRKSDHLVLSNFPFSWLLKLKSSVFFPGFHQLRSYTNGRNRLWWSVSVIKKDWCETQCAQARREAQRPVVCRCAVQPFGRRRWRAFDRG